jgi:hypothetical protein
MRRWRHSRSACARALERRWRPSSRSPTAWKSTPACRGARPGGGGRRRCLCRPGAQGRGRRLRADSLGGHRHAGWRAIPGLAIERFTRHGPAALLPLRPGADGQARAALVWCVPTGDDPVLGLTAAQRLAVLSPSSRREAGRLVAITPLKSFALGLNAERTLVSGRTVRIGNAAQTLHPVAGQGLNLGCATCMSWSTRCAGRGTWTRPAPRRMGARRRPLEHHRHHRFPGAQLHLEAARRGQRPRPGSGRAAGRARRARLAGAADDVRRAMSQRPIRT